MKRAENPTRKGRPRAFDPERALDQAMRVFWKHGYEGTSLPALTRAMGINRPSLYAAFGNKEALFRKALDRYAATTGGVVADALKQPSARGVVETLFRAGLTCESAGPGLGCMLVQSALVCSDASERVRADVCDRRRAVELLLRDRFERAKSEGDLPADADPAALAKFVVTVQHGLAVQLAGGADRASLLAAVDVALRAWPG